MFDEVWEDIPNPPGDDHRNRYTFGRIGDLPVVLAYGGGMGKTRAATVATSLALNFPDIEVGFLVDICAAVPISRKGSEIFLGDVVVSTGVIQYDLVRQYQDMEITKDGLNERLACYRPSMQKFIHQAQGQWALHKLLEETAAKTATLGTEKHGKYKPPGPEFDVVFDPKYLHCHHAPTGCEICDPKNDVVCDFSRTASCQHLNCDTKENQRLRPGTSVANPQIHFGVFGSGDRVQKSGTHRDDIGEKHPDIVAFEMEGAGVWETIPTTIVKAACDYGDSHREKRWHPFAAFTAASCARALILLWGKRDDLPSPESDGTPVATDDRFLWVSTNQYFMFC
jgi:nucleoside phosphorylase